MSTADEVNFILTIKLFHHVTAEQVASASWGDGPADGVIGIGPHQVTHGTIVWHFLLAVKRANLIEGINRGREATMNTEDFVVDNGGQSKVVEDVSAVPPHVNRAKLTQALVIKAVDLSDLARLVVASDESDSLRITYFQGNKKQEGLD